MRCGEHILLIAIAITIVADPEDNLSLADRAKLEKKLEKQEDEAKEHKLRPTEIALSHGNKPSK